MPIQIARIRGWCSHHQKVLTFPDPGNVFSRPSWLPIKSLDNEGWCELDKKELTCPDGEKESIYCSIFWVWQGEEVLPEQPRCPDCGAEGEIKGHMTCQYPKD